MEYSEGKSDGSELCPGCGEALAPHRVGSVQAARCGSCRGLWVARRDLRAAVGGLVLAAPSPAAASERTCLRCYQAMSERVLAEVTVDVCAGCDRLFLDQAELEHLREAIAARRTGKAAALTGALAASSGPTGNRTGELGAEAVDVASTALDLTDLVGGVVDLVAGLADL